MSTSYFAVKEGYDIRKHEVDGRVRIYAEFVGDTEDVDTGFHLGEFDVEKDHAFAVARLFRSERVIGLSTSKGFRWMGHRPHPKVVLISEYGEIMTAEEIENGLK